MDFFIGGLAGAGATIFTNPMDVVKTRMQLQGELLKRGDYISRYKSVPHALYVIAKTDGVLALQKGLVPGMLFGFCMNSVRLGIYHIAQVQGWTKNNAGDINIYKTLLWSSASGFLGGLAANPSSVLKTRMQAAAHPSIAVGRQHIYNGMIDGFIKIYKAESIRGFFVGMNANCCRLAIGSAAQLTSFSTSKEILLEYDICTQSPLGLAFCASSLSGLIVALATCPIDVASVRLQNQGSASKGDLLYSGVVACIVKTFRAEGIHGLYKGMGPLYFRIAPQTTISLVIWDMLNLFFNNKNS